MHAQETPIFTYHHTRHTTMLCAYPPLANPPFGHGMPRQPRAADDHTNKKSEVACPQRSYRQLNTREVYKTLANDTFAALNPTCKTVSLLSCTQPKISSKPRMHRIPPSQPTFGAAKKIHENRGCIAFRPPPCGKKEKIFLLASDKRTFSSSGKNTKIWSIGSSTWPNTGHGRG